MSSARRSAALTSCFVGIVQESIQHVAQGQSKVAATAAPHLAAG